MKKEKLCKYQDLINLVRQLIEIISVSMKLSYKQYS